MFLVVMRWNVGQLDTICCVTETRDKAQEYIDKEMEGKVYSGLGIHHVIPVKVYV